MADSTGMADLRSENVSKVVNGFALQKFVMKQVVMTQSSSSWKESYFQETATELTAQGNRNIKGIPRLANFPYGEPNWTKQSSYMEKYGQEGVVSYEDAKTNDVSVIARTLLRIARAVANSVDAEIYSQLSSNAGNTETIGAGDEWNSATLANRDPIQDILNAQKLITIDNYNPYDGSTFLILSPTDFANLLGNANVRNAGQFYTDAVTRNGRVGTLLGMSVLVSNVVTADEALVVIGKEAATWQAASPLNTVSIEDPGVKWTIRSWEIGVTQVTNPNAIAKIANTQA